MMKKLMVIGLILVGASAFAEDNGLNPGAPGSNNTTPAHQASPYDAGPNGGACNQDNGCGLAEGAAPVAAVVRRASDCVGTALPAYDSNFKFIGYICVSTGRD